MLLPAPALHPLTGAASCESVVDELASQMESRMKNIESTVEQRFLFNETKMNEVVGKIVMMMETIDDNDNNVKSELKSKFETLEQSVIKLSA